MIFQVRDDCQNGNAEFGADPLENFNDRTELPPNCNSPAVSTIWPKSVPAVPEWLSFRAASSQTFVPPPFRFTPTCKVKTPPDAAERLPPFVTTTAPLMMPFPPRTPA